jgi:hypothetical protein
MKEGTALRGRLSTWVTAMISPDRYAHFILAIPEGERRRLAAGWFALGLVALVGAGLLSILLVLSRTPYLQNLFPLADFFHVALVVHVDLSVLVWFVAFAGVLWTLNSTSRFIEVAQLALVLCLIGTGLMLAAPFLGRGGPIMSNYVPVLEDPLFLSGLVVFGGGFALLTLRSLLAPVPVGLPLDGGGALRFGLNTAAVSAAIALIALAWSYQAIPASYVGKPYYELLFWGSGHVIQFTWTLFMLVAWFWLGSLCGALIPLSPRVTVLLFAVGLVSVFVVPIIYLVWEVTSVEHMKMHVWLMRFGGGLAILPLGLAVLIGLLRAAPADAHMRPLRASLIASMVLFSVGGAFGFLIQGSDVRIPAHYHGCIVGVTLAMMGLGYALLPHFGFTAPRTGLATAQPYIYGAGQLLHIIGLVWSGGYGVQRKVAGSEQILRTPQEIAGMGLMGIGGMVAIVGGLLFLVVVYRAWKRA